MQSSRLKKFALAAALSLSFAFAYRSLAHEPGRARNTSTASAVSAVTRAPAAMVLYGRSVARFGGYKLDISFTPDGRLVCFGIAADTPSAPRAY
ncbi:MAG TPA: hypothetical protein VEY09_16905 [Pyrinomonadaceae bacterium]|nr:hypothetical protein [Pyrinomonadaceae bacterium]